MFGNKHPFRLVSPKCSKMYLVLSYKYAMIYIKILQMHLVIIIFMLAYIFELHLFHFVMRELHCDPDALCLAQTISFKNQQKNNKKNFS